jgi:carbon-monoxide dehydrogenase large subunit/6-hydroxypseudooxynicotine dehydrogenase subunit gamma
VHVATLKTRAKALEMAAAMLAVPEDELDIANGEIFRKGSADRIGVSLADVATALEPTSKTLGEREPGLTALGWFSSDHMNYPYGVHIAVVNVERATGVVKVERYLLGYDIGRAINPMLVDGQLVGGFAQGLGGALYEEFLYDESGQPLSVTLADYLIPTAHEVPPVETLVTEDAPSPLNPLGLKGAGEGGITGVGACIASAVDDALGIPGAVTQIPVTPQRVREILRGHADRARST